MLMSTDPFGEVDRLTRAMWGQGRSAGMPITAYREEDAFVVHVDLPGVSPQAIEASIERNVLTIRAERTSPVPTDGASVIDERSYGPVARQLVLGDTLAVDDLTADYDAGVLTVRIPIAPQPKPRKIEIKGSDEEVTKLHA